jgi:hypothetical protein
MKLTKAQHIPVGTIISADPLGTQVVEVQSVTHHRRAGTVTLECLDAMTGEPTTLKMFDTIEYCLD